MELIYTDPEGNKSQHALQSLFVVGRGSNCNISVNDERASRQHFKIVADEGGFSLVDTSSNGTRLNGRSTKESELMPGDVIEIGSGCRFDLIETSGDPADDMMDTGFETLSLNSPSARPKLSLDDLEEHMDSQLAFIQALQLCQQPKDFLHAIGVYLDGQTGLDRLVLCLYEGNQISRFDREGANTLKRWAQLPLSTTVVEQARELKQAVLARNVHGELSDSRSADIASISSVISVPLISSTMGEDGVCFAVLYADRMGDSPSFEINDLKILTQTALSLGRALEAWLLHRQLRKEKNPGDLLGSSKEVSQLKKMISRGAVTESPILITGPSGSGKRFVAHLIHGESLRSSQPFVRVDCPSLIESLAASELFGHVKGAFTGADEDRLGCFERANGGTLLLDHVDELDPEVQSLLLRTLESKTLRPVGGTEEIPVNVRLLSTASPELEKKIDAGNFRQDLLFRLQVINCQLPGLSERREDVPELAAFFLQEMTEASGRPLMKWEAGFMEALSNQDWPGNVRELKNCLEHLMIMSPDATLRIKDLQQSDEKSSMLLEYAIHDHIRRVLVLTHGNKSQAAETLGIDRSTLYARIKQMDKQ
jgi:DNA-binding NtrC family response regulator